MRIGDYFIPQRFIDAVASHIVMNAIEISHVRTPLILGIHGPMGEGKTEQCRTVLQVMRVKPIWVFGDNFESKEAGNPARLIKDKYREASDFNANISSEYSRDKYNHTALLAILFINDVDQRIGRSDNLIQQTINTQLLNASLMEIADSPREIDGITSSRVPIVMTGNNLGVLHRPLIRDGRMQKFEWRPSLEEKIQIVRHLFSEETISDNEIRDFVIEFASPDGADKPTSSSNNLSVSSFATIRYLIYRAEVLKMIDEVGLLDVLDYVLRGKHRSQLRLPLFTLASLRQAAHELITSGLIIDHLKE